MTSAILGELHHKNHHDSSDGDRPVVLIWPDPGHPTHHSLGQISKFSPNEGPIIIPRGDVKNTKTDASKTINHHNHPSTSFCPCIFNGSLRTFTLAPCIDQGPLPNHRGCLQTAIFIRKMIEKTITFWRNYLIFQTTHIARLKSLGLFSDTS